VADEHQPDAQARAVKIGEVLVADEHQPDAQARAVKIGEVLVADEHQPDAQARATKRGVAKQNASKVQVMMYAIIEDGGRQYKVEEGQVIEVDYRDVPSGQSITFERVFAVRDDQGLRLGQPTLNGANVTAEVVGAMQGPKLVVQKFRRRKTMRRKTGHRQIHTRVKISKINA
jgi:large subunit ribosomal protein L21